MTALKASKLFCELLAAELNSLEETAQLKTYKAGRHIFKEGESGDGLYTIVKGKVARKTSFRSAPVPVSAIVETSTFLARNQVES